MPITINGTGTITGISAGGLPDSCITTDELASSAVTSAKLASGASRANFGAGAILQVVQTTLTTVKTINTAGWNNITELDLSITLASASNRVLLMTSIPCSTNTNATLRLVRSVSGVETPIFVSTSPAGAGVLSSGGDIYGGTYSGNSTGAYNFVDSPSATSVIYRIQAWGLNLPTYPLYINASNFDGDATHRVRGASSFIAMEISA
jgi:hypothetical protein